MSSIDSKFFSRTLFSAILAGALFACGGGESADTSGDGAGADDGYVEVKGSDTMVHLVTAWAEAFGASDGGAEVGVTGGGSGTGIAALTNGTTDIAAASRDMKQKEIDLAKSKGITPVEHVVARDGIAVVVHPSNPVSELTLDQLKQIYTGAATNWNQVGGADQSIDVLSRESSSGTFVFFQEHVLAKEDYASNARLMPATSGITNEVKENASAIGYIGLGYLGDGLKAIAVKSDDNSPAVLPSEATVKSGEYSVARPLFLYTNGEPTGSIKAFLDFANSGQGQEIVKESGYVPAE